MNIKSPLVVPHLPMKDMDGTMLVLAINEYMSSMSNDEVALIKDALSLAAYLHRKDTRMSATQASNGERNQPSTPYITHPLRNTLRLLRWGVTDAHILAASLLHDVVEDHPREIVREFTDVEVARRDKKRMRQVALDYLAKTFGADVAHIVNAMSNPILPGDMEREERNRHYIDHVEHAIADPRVFLAKLSDVADNAMSLHHVEDITSPQVVRRAVKYLPLADIFPAEFVRNQDIRRYLSAEGAEDIAERLAGMKDYLLSIATLSE